MIKFLLFMLIQYAEEIIGDHQYW